MLHHSGSSQITSLFPLTFVLCPEYCIVLSGGGLKKKRKVVWDSSRHKADECDEIAENIRRFCSMQIVVMFDEMTFSTPIDIPEYHPEDETFLRRLPR